MTTFESFGIDTRGRLSGEIKTTCPQCSQHRKKKSYPCLNVNLDKGVWHCWHCGWTGSLGAGVQHRAKIEKVYRKPEYRPNATELPDSVVSWFASRGIGQQTLIRNKINHGMAYFPQVEDERSCVMFPFYRGGECVNIKYRTGDKLFRLAGGAERILFGLDDIGESLVWVEGEMDKLSVEEAGIASCVSVPDGAPSPDSKSYESKFDFLDCPEIEAVQTHIIAVDNDAPGNRLEEELVRRLGRDKCLIVSWPEGCKDANDVLVKHGPDVLNECIAYAKPVPIEGGYTVADFETEILRHYDGDIPRGVTTGWDNVDEHYRVMSGEWTLVTGIPGHGKSEWLDALTINLARVHGWSFGVYSPENQPISYHSEKMLEKVAGKPFGNGPTERMSKEDVSAGLAFLHQHFHFMLPEYPTLDTLFDQAQALVRQHGIRGLIIDPWNEIDHVREGNESETDYISRALTKIRRFARKNHVHVWIVAHPTKLQKDKNSGQYPVPTPYDVSGSSHWRNKADNCISMYRHLGMDHMPVELHVQKVRKKVNGKVGMVEMDYDRVTGRYHQRFGGAKFSSSYSPVSTYEPDREEML